MVINFSEFDIENDFYLFARWHLHLLRNEETENGIESKMINFNKRAIKCNNKEKTLKGAKCISSAY